MPNDNVKRMLEKLPFRDAVKLHNELLSKKPLCLEVREKVQHALRKANITIVPSH